MNLRVFQFTLLCIVCLVEVANGQDFFDGFEDGLANWTIIRGNAAVSGFTFVEGSQSVRLFDGLPDEERETLLLRDSFQGQFGKYTFHTNAAGDVSDCDFLFQYIDENNYYQLSYRPLGTDNPNVELTKVVDGVFEQIAIKVGEGMINQWVEVQVDRTCSGQIIVSIDGKVALNIEDKSIMLPGTIGLRAWDQDSYFDSISYGQGFEQWEIIQEMATICFGETYNSGTVNYTQSGVYRDSILNPIGCDTIIELNLIVRPKAVDSVTFAICPGDTVLVNDKVFTEFGIYQEQTISADGCDSIIDFEIRIYNMPRQITDTFLCMGDTLQIDSLFIFMPQTIRYVEPNDFCGVEHIINVEFFQPIRMASDSLHTCPGETITLDLSGTDNVLWENGQTGTAILIDQPGTYVYQGRDIESGCLFFDSITVHQECAFSYYSPTAFTPNDSDPNDEWTIFFAEPPETFQLTIYDKWGNQVYQTADSAFRWNGNINQDELPSGVYVWHAEINATFHHGSITLIR